MKRAIVFTMALILLCAWPVFAQSQQQQQPQRPQTQRPESGQGWFCPWCGGPSGYSDGQEMMHGRGGMRGQGMHHGWSRGQCPMGQTEAMQPMSKEDARQLMQQYVAANPNLKIGEITEKEEVYTGEIVTKDDSLVEKVVLDKKTGWMKRTY